jgi:hypothetical protein
MKTRSPHCDLGARASIVASGEDRGEYPPPCHFHLIGVGLPKTGTTSLANLFQRFRWGYEFLFPESVERLVAWKEGGLDRDEVERSVVQRSL